MAEVKHELAETPEEIAYELRAAEGSLWTGSRLLVGIIVMAYASLAFAYFYLRSLNSENLWRPLQVTAPTGTGAAVMAFTVAGTAMALLGMRRLRQGQTLDWVVAGWITVLAALIAVGLQIWQLTTLPFFPGSSGYASCFIAWAIMNVAMILGGTYWTETLVTRTMRLRRTIEEEGGTATSPQPTARLLRANAEGAVFFWGFIAVVAVFFWVLFYVI